VSPSASYVCRTFHLISIRLVHSIEKNSFVISEEKLCGTQKPVSDFWIQGWTGPQKPPWPPGLQVFTLATKMTQGDDESSVQRNVEDIQVGMEIILKLVSNIVGISARLTF